ncbi:MAG TPA: hypothetical protein PKA82_17170 [Pyrinomonadaceae bacterium]|nr:hypothetical protein [Pyrinomonadaceae bacterium]
MLVQDDSHTPRHFPTVAETLFENAVASFRHFLDSQEVTDPIVWIFVEDVLTTIGQQSFHSPFWLKSPIPNENEELARYAYIQAQERGFGVGLIGFARYSAGLCCAVLAPTDDIDAQYSMLGPDGVRYSLVSTLRTAREIKSPLLWKIMKLLRFRFRDGNYVENLPSKRAFHKQKARIV